MEVKYNTMVWNTFQRSIFIFLRWRLKGSVRNILEFLGPGLIRLITINYELNGAIMTSEAATEVHVSPFNSELIVPKPASRNSTMLLTLPGGSQRVKIFKSITWYYWTRKYLGPWSLLPIHVAVFWRLFSYIEWYA